MTNVYPHAQHGGEEVVKRCSVKPLLSKTSKNSEEITEVYFNKDAEPAKVFSQNF